jgi:DNA-binding MarR family transcriptional regulator
MEHVSAGKDGLSRPQRESVDAVAAALATVGNWMFAPATRRKIMASSGLELSLGDYTLLAQVSLHAPVRLSVLAELMEVDKSTLSPPAKRLESRGFIERRPDPADARAQLVSVTRAGKLAISKLWKARTAAVAALLAEWEAGDIEQLAASLGALSEAIKKGK